jgi:O-antigen ligase/Flp pilus assembly protein TadD
VVIFVSVVRAHDAATLRGFALVLVVAAAVVVGYAIAQWIGIDPVDWGRKDELFSTLGNPNFLAGWIGAVLPVCLGVAVARTLALPWRIVAGLTALAIVPVSFGSNSFQGPMTVAVSAVAFVGLLFARGAIPIPTALRGRRGLIVLGIVVLVAAPIGVKILADGLDQGLLERKYFYRVAVEVVADHPIVGAGPDTFHNQFLSRRPPEHVAIGGANAGAVHDVPLGVLAEGGLLSGIPYLAFIGLVGWRLVVAVRRGRGEAWLVAGVGAAWIGYQTQSLVSIDKPALAVLHWALAGAIVVLAGPIEARILPLPGQRTRTAESAPPATVVAVGVIAVVALAAGWVATRPFRADLADIAGKQALERSDGDAAKAHLERARELAPWEAAYTYDQVILGSRANVPELALGAAIDGAELEPGDSSYAVVAGKVADAVKRPAVARKWFDRAIEEDPYGFDPLLSGAVSAAQAGDADRAHELIRRALDVSRTNASVWTQVGDAYAVLREDADARKAYERALDLAPGYKLALKGLRQLDK